MSDDSDPRLDTMWAVQERGLPHIVSAVITTTRGQTG